MIKYNMNKHSGPLCQKSNFSPPRDDKFFELPKTPHITPPKTFQFILGVAGKRDTDFVPFVTILPIFAAKRPDYNILCCRRGQLFKFLVSFDAK